MIVPAGSTDVSVYYYIVQDASGTAAGEPQTGLLFSDIQTGGSASYVRQGAARVAVTAVTLASSAAAHSDGGFVEIDSANTPGLYRFDYPDAAFATGVDIVFCQIVVEASKNAVANPVVVDLDKINALVAAQPTTPEFNARSLPTAEYFDATTDKVTLAEITHTGAIIPQVTSVTNLSSSSAGIATNSESFTNTAGGTQVNTFEDTKALDGVLHSVAPSGGNTDFYYEANVGADGVPIEVSWEGYANSNGDEYQVFGFDYSTTTYVPVGIVAASNSTVVGLETFKYSSNLVGTGVNLGNVRFRVTSSDGTNISTDRLLFSYAVVNQDAGYVGGSVWYNSAASNTGSQRGIDGVITNPVSSEASARAIADAANLKKIHCLPASLYTLDQAYDGFEFAGFNYLLDLNGQSFNSSSAKSAAVLGNDSGSNPGFSLYQDCQMRGNTLGQHALIECGIAGSVVLGESGSYSWIVSREAPAVVSSLDYNSTLNASAVVVSQYSGALTVNNMGQGTGSYTLTLTGQGTLTIAASCTGGVITKSGAWTVVDNSGGSVTIVEDGLQSTVSNTNDNLVTEAQVLTKVNEALDTAIPELPVGVPPATPSLREASVLQHMALRNKKDVQTSGTDSLEIHNDAGTLITQKLITDDGTDYSEAQMS